MNLLFALPGLIALLLVFWYAVIVIKARRIGMSALCLGLFGVLSSEVIFYLSELKAEDESTYKLMQLYYLSAIFSCLIFLEVTLHLSGWLKPWLYRILLLIGLVNASLILIPDMAFIGVKKISYGVTRIPGPYYWMPQITLAACIITSLFLLFLFGSKSTDWLKRRQANILLLGSVWLFVCVIIVMLLMQLGLPINAFVVLPVAISIFVGVQIYAELDERIFKLLAFIPASNEQQLTKNTIDALLKYKSGDLQAAVNDFERGIILDMLKKCDGNKSLAAKELGISRATLRRKLEEVEECAESLASSP